MNAPVTNFISLTTLAQRLNLPAAWLKLEANSGRLPHLKVGQRFRFDLQLVEQALLERASANSQSDSQQSNKGCNDVS